MYKLHSFLLVIILIPAPNVCIHQLQDDSDEDEEEDEICFLVSALELLLYVATNSGEERFRSPETAFSLEPVHMQILHDRYMR